MIYTDEQLLDFLREHHALTNQIPNSTQVSGRYPAATTYKRRFGSWSQALKAAGLATSRKPRENPILVTCATCKNIFTKRVSQFKQSCSGLSFCGHSCSATYNNVGVCRNPKLKEAENCKWCGKLILNNRSSFCNNRCQRQHEWVNSLVPAIELGLISNRPTLRKYLIKKHGYECSECHITKWHGNPAPLCLDHTDGNAGNNKPENIRLLCQNCHALTPTFAGRNRGNGRKSRGIKRHDDYD
jgi:hypothetical protein